MKTLTRVVYMLFGGLGLIAGSVALLRPTLILSPDVYSPLTAHLVREQAAGFVFIGLMFFWCLRHFDRRRPVHLALLLFTFLFAVIHWSEYLQDHRDIWSPALNTIPSLVLAITAPFNRGWIDRASSKVS